MGKGLSCRSFCTLPSGEISLVSLGDSSAHELTDQKPRSEHLAVLERSQASKIGSRR